MHSKGIHFHVSFTPPLGSKKQQQLVLSGPIDIVVATPTRFLQHVKEGNVYFKDINWLVVDEADTILADQGWAAELKTILQPLRARADRPKAGVVLVSATMTKVRRSIGPEASLHLIHLSASLPLPFPSLDLIHLSASLPFEPIPS